MDGDEETVLSLNSRAMETKEDAGQSTILLSCFKGGIPSKRPKSYIFFERGLKKTVTNKNTEIYIFVVFYYYNEIKKWLVWNSGPVKKYKCANSSLRSGQRWTVSLMQTQEVILQQKSNNKLVS